MSNMHTIFAIEDRRERDILINRAVMKHFNLGLELLNNTSIRSENIIIHVHRSMEITLMFDMINYIQFLAALWTSSKLIVEYAPIKPMRIIEYITLCVIFILDLFWEKFLIFYFFVNWNDILGEVCYLHWRARQEF